MIIVAALFFMSFYFVITIHHRHHYADSDMIGWYVVEDDIVGKEATFCG